jgi:hypothetical protein
MAADSEALARRTDTAEAMQPIAEAAVRPEVSVEAVDTAAVDSEAVATCLRAVVADTSAAVVVLDTLVAEAAAVVTAVAVATADATNPRQKIKMPSHCGRHFFLGITRVAICRAQFFYKRFKPEEASQAV